MRWQIVHEHAEESITMIKNCVSPFTVMIVYTENSKQSINKQLEVMYELVKDPDTGLVLTNSTF